MHVNDYGTVRIGFCQVLRVGFDNASEKWKYIRADSKASEHARYVSVLSDAFRVLRKCTPDDYARKPRDPFSDAHHYKTAECRTVGYRYMPALRKMPRLAKFIKEPGLFDNYMNLVVYCRLICHFSAKPLSDVSRPRRQPFRQKKFFSDYISNFLRFVYLQEVLTIAQEHLHAYLAYFIRLRRWHMFPAVVHFTTHIWEDCKRFGCAAGYLSAYPFENQLSIFSKVNRIIVI